MAQFESTIHDASEDKHVILSRTGIECGSLTEEEMTNMLKEDIAKANAIYMEMTVPDIERKNANYLARQMLFVRDYASKKWKSKKRRNAYCEEMTAKLSNYYKPEPIGYFDLHLGNEGMGVCMIRPDNDFSFGNAFRQCKGNRYWNAAHGWNICYTSRSGEFLSDGRPFIDLVLDDDVREEKEMTSKGISDMMAEAHAEMTYNGD